MNHPQHGDRHAFSVTCGAASLGMLAGAAAIAHAHRDFRFGEAPLESLELGLYLLLLLAGATISGWFAIGAARGPGLTSRQRVSGDEWGVLVGVGLGAGLFDAMAVRMLRDLRDGVADSAILPACVTMLGALFTFGLLWNSGKLLLRGRSRVILPAGPLFAGATLEAELELPFAANRAPAVTATLSLVRSAILGSDIDESPSHQTLWSEQLELNAWRPRGAARSRATLRFAPPDGVPWDLGCDGAASYFWNLRAESATPEVEFVANYLLPIAFEDPFAEGIIART